MRRKSQSTAIYDFRDDLAKEDSLATSQSAIHHKDKKAKFARVDPGQASEPASALE